MKKLSGGCLPEPKSIVLVKELSDNYIVYELTAFTENEHGVLQISSNIRENISLVFRENKVEILSPAHVNLGQPPKEEKNLATTVPVNPEQVEVPKATEIQENLKKAKDELNHKKEEFL